MGTRKYSGLLLLIIHNSDLRRQILERITDINILEASNGRMGLELAKEHLPDVVICENQIPEISGYKLCHHLKFLPSTSQISFILLSNGKAQPESQTGQERGPDYNWNLDTDDIDELVVLVKKYSEKERLKRNSTSEFADSVSVVIEENMHLPEFNVAAMCVKLGMNRVRLTSLFQEYFNQSPGKYLHKKRLQKAKELIAKSSMNMAEIGYSVGFNHPSYFSKCFKEAFACSPKEYAAQFD